MNRDIESVTELMRTLGQGVIYLVDRETGRISPMSIAEYTSLTFDDLDRVHVCARIKDANAISAKILKRS